MTRSLVELAVDLIDNCSRADEACVQGSEVSSRKTRGVQPRCGEATNRESLSAAGGVAGECASLVALGSWIFDVTLAGHGGRLGGGG